MNVPFAERWGRFDEAVMAMRALWDPTAAPFVGRFYDTSGVVLEPGPARSGGPPIWIGSWGSETGLARVARLGDGWLASAYNATPALFEAGRQRLGELLEARGRDASGFPNTLVTMWLHVTTDERERQDVVERLAGMLKRPLEQIEERLPIGPPALCAEIVERYREAGVERILFWPLTDEVRQVERVALDVLPLTR
jgi:alkanesulfonate monooxygenase SsuD/methylene tetrahydromethanopterin reductase-like flavin-dependent oxidoreductase (luciferase family)